MCRMHTMREGTIGSYLAALGFNVDFAPVADVLTNPDNQVIGQRSFGSDAQTVAGMVTSERRDFPRRECTVWSSISRDTVALPEILMTGRCPRTRPWRN